jgi:hypothetical protein
MIYSWNTASQREYGRYMPTPSASVKRPFTSFFADKDELVQAVLSDVITNNKDCCERDVSISENAVHEIFIAMDMIVETLGGYESLPHFRYAKNITHRLTKIPPLQKRVPLQCYAPEFIKGYRRRVVQGGYRRRNYVAFQGREVSWFALTRSFKRRLSKTW